MMTPNALERLAVARPEIARRTTDVMDDRERAELCASVVAVSPLDGAALRNVRYRRRWGVLLGAGVAAGVVAVVLVLVPVHSPDASAAILAKAAAVITSKQSGVVALHDLVYEPIGAAPITVDSWIDPQNAHHYRVRFYDPRTQFQEAGQYVHDGHVISIGVDFQSRHVIEIPLPTSRSVRPLPQIPSSVAQITGLLRSGSLTVVGHQAVAGVDALHLKGHLQGFQSLDLWIDPTSYELVQFQVEKRGYRSVESVRFLPPTAENLTLLNVVIPTGFRLTVLPPPPSPTQPGARR